jgi:hypothetical protein
MRSSGERVCFEPRKAFEHKDDAKIGLSEPTIKLVVADLGVSCGDALEDSRRQWPGFPRCVARGTMLHLNRTVTHPTPLIYLSTIIIKRMVIETYITTAIVIV